MGKVDDLMSGIGYGKYSARQVLARCCRQARRIPSRAILNPKADSDSPAASPASCAASSAITTPSSVKGQGDMLVYRARCCNPIRGENIVGYITRGKGVAVHSVNCPNVTNLMYEPERRIDVEWARDEHTPTAYPVKLTVFCDDRFGMLKNITGVIGDAKSNIRNIGAHTSNSQASVEVVLDISDLNTWNRSSPD